MKQFDGSDASNHQANLRCPTSVFGKYLNSYTTAPDYLPDDGAMFVKDAAGDNQVPLFPFYITSPQFVTVPLGEISSKCDIWAMPRGMMTDNDTVTCNGGTYLVLGKDGLYGRYAVRVS